MSRVRGGPGLARWLTPPLALVLAACTAAVAGCTAAEPRPAASTDDTASPFADCAALAAPPASTPPPAATTGQPGAIAAETAGQPGATAAETAGQPGAGAAGAAGQPSGQPDAAAAVGGTVRADLPDLVLPCFTGERPVRLTELRGPAVLNVWGSWCGPCREELPVMQALADATAGRLRVVGVDTRDTRDAAASFAAGRGISLPMLFDPDQRLLGALGRVNVPLTVFVAADGKRFVYTGKALDKPTLGGLVRTHTGVTVTG